MRPSFSLLALLTVLPLGLPLAAHAEDAVKPEAEAQAVEAPSPWNGSGQLGYASSRGNSTNESLNGRLTVQYTRGEWIHGADIFGLRTSAEYRSTDADGNVSTQRKNTANRYTLGLNSALKLAEHRQFTTALRFEQDEFATYDWQQTASIGYGTRVMDGSRTQLDVQVGPGYRRAHDADSQETESGLIGRGFIGLKYDLTENTELANTLLIESGRHNTFAQNELGLSVAMNSHLALKAGLQARRNSDVDENTKKTDTLTTMNVVYKFR